MLLAPSESASDHHDAVAICPPHAFCRRRFSKSADVHARQIPSLVPRTTGLAQGISREPVDNAFRPSQKPSSGVVDALPAWTFGHLVCPSVRLPFFVEDHHVDPLSRSSALAFLIRIPVLLHSGPTRMASRRPIRSSTGTHDKPPPLREPSLIEVLPWQNTRQRRVRPRAEHDP